MNSKLGDNMKKANIARHVEAAYTLGYAAAMAEKMRVSALDGNVTKLMAAKSHAVMDILTSWYEGYDRCIDEQVVAIFPEDKFFQNKLKAK